MNGYFGSAILRRLDRQSEDSDIFYWTKFCWWEKQAFQAYIPHTWRSTLCKLCSLTNRSWSNERYYLPHLVSLIFWDQHGYNNNWYFKGRLNNLFWFWKLSLLSTAAGRALRALCLTAEIHQVPKHKSSEMVYYWITLKNWDPCYLGITCFFGI